MSASHETPAVTPCVTTTVTRPAAALSVLRSSWSHPASPRPSPAPPSENRSPNITDCWQLQSQEPHLSRLLTTNPIQRAGHRQTWAIHHESMNPSRDQDASGKSTAARISLEFECWPRIPIPNASATRPPAHPTPGSGSCSTSSTTRTSPPPHAPSAHPRSLDRPHSRPQANSQSQPR
ncbi:hypothetical protein Poly21_55590 [Allorhodopirellula heiligendammensis]|uniref:Uncharacterized protein n=1 Tax=Allorhodopirellula heiligendammensis TaxID=2714739 RepID=A0A5C6B9F9_9BACT|nr:hypothetical protein Poly21_55590 [Allorhodopirellula heiligendammensis]